MCFLTGVSSLGIRSVQDAVLHRVLKDDRTVVPWGLALTALNRVFPLYHYVDPQPSTELLEVISGKVLVLTVIFRLLFIL